MLTARIDSRCAFACATITLVSFGMVTACSGGDPASPSLSEVVYVAPDAAVDVGVDVALDQALADITEAASCPRGDLPNACPSPAPSWMNSVRNIISTRCGPCHFPAGVDDPKRDFSTYQSVHLNSGSILASVAGCAMPPPDSGAPTLAERETLLAWLVCAAPDN
jgi:hypothetical protein